MKNPIKLFYDNMANSLVVWFDNPQKEAYSSEAEDEVVLMKDEDGRVIGFEKLNFILPQSPHQPQILPLEVLTKR